MPEPVVPRPAATVALVRDCPGGFEVLMMQRNEKSKFMPGVFVFPGGALDREDDDPLMYARCRGMDDERASRRLNLERGGLSYWIAVVRECFEEAGVLLCCDAGGRLVTLTEPDAQQRYARYRDALNAGDQDFLALCQAENLTLAADRITYFSHWITPEGAPRRYDTRFFAALMPEGQEPLHDANELVDQVWVRPRDALERGARNEFPIRTPTRATLSNSPPRRDTADLFRRFDALTDIPAILPKVSGDGGRILPGQPGYDDASRHDPSKWK